MDDTSDRGASRAPELEDLVSLCRALNAEGARYVLIGGFAVILHGLVRTTKDVDLLGRACGIDYAAALEAGIEVREIGGVPVPLATKKLLVRMKDTVRESDAADVRFLKLRMEEEGR